MKMSQLSTVPNNHVFGPNRAKIAAVETLEGLARRRIRALYEREGRDGSKWTAEKLAPFLGMTDPSGVRKLLNGDNKISLAHVEGFCEAFGITAAEMLAEPGALIMPVQPIEAALIALFRQMTELERRSLLTVLERPVAAQQSRKSRLGRAMLTVKEQELVDLFARVKRDGVREGVLKTLRGAAQDDPYAAPDKPRTTG